MRKAVADCRDIRSLGGRVATLRRRCRASRRVNPLVESARFIDLPPTMLPTRITTLVRSPVSAPPQKAGAIRRRARSDEFSFDSSCRERSANLCDFPLQRWSGGTEPSTLTLHAQSNAHCRSDNFPAALRLPLAGLREAIARYTQRRERRSPIKRLQHYRLMLASRQNCRMSIETSNPQDRLAN